VVVDADFGIFFVEVFSVDVDLQRHSLDFLESGAI
jgi:hypothetical protein